MTRVAAVDCGTNSIRRSTSVCPPESGTSVTSRRIELVPQSMEATRVMSRRPGAARTAPRPTTPPCRPLRGRRSG